MASKFRGKYLQIIPLGESIHCPIMTAEFSHLYYGRCYVALFVNVLQTLTAVATHETRVVYCTDLANCSNLATHAV